MKTFFSMTFSACLLFAASACSSELDPGQEDFDLQGVIIQIANHGEEHLRILVQYADKLPSDGTGKVWLLLGDETELLKQEGRAIQKVDSEALEVGQEVRAWSSDVWLYSNPPQAGARRVVIDKKQSAELWRGENRGTTQSARGAPRNPADMLRYD